MTAKSAAPGIVKADWVWSRLESGEPLVVADVRFSPKDSSYGKSAYERGHLPGAVFVDFKAELTDPAGEHGGRSPLPSPERLAAAFGRLGIDRTVPVVVYEDGIGPAAARLWWILTYLGHGEAYILDGGYEAWTAAGFPVTDEKPLIGDTIGASSSVIAGDAGGVFEPELRPELLAGVEEVRAAASQGGERGERQTVLVDSRDASQYLGLEAPFDPVAGHIPGAVNYFWKGILAEDGGLKSSEELRAHYRPLDPEQEIIVYCGSGISACPNVLALQAAGFNKVKLYAGSWSDWISYGDNPIATGDE